MAKAEVGTAKYLSKRLKASGLQRLRYYCQLCAKQCRDANGFKNHLSSPSHTHRANDLGESGKASQVVQNYSNTLKSDFLRMLRVNHGTKSIDANKFYQEYILSDKHHVHMNATRWSSLTSFIKYLGENGLVKITETGSDYGSSEPSLDILFINHNDPAQRKRQDHSSSLRTEATFESKILHDQIEAGKLFHHPATESANPRCVNEGPIQVSLLFKKKAPSTKTGLVFENESFDEDLN